MLSKIKKGNRKSKKETYRGSNGRVKRYSTQKPMRKIVESGKSRGGGA